MGGKQENELLAKAAGFAVADSAQGFFWVKVLFPEERGGFFTSARDAWGDCVERNNLLDA